MRPSLLLVPALFIALSGTSTAQRPIHANPDHERARQHYLTGWQHMRSEEFDRAAEEFRSAVELNSRFAVAYYGLGRAYQNLHRYVEAVEALTASRDLYREQASTKFNNQMEADRYRKDRLMELQDMRAQVAKGPQNERTANELRQVENAIRLTSEDQVRGLDITIEQPVPSFVSLSLGSALFRTERYDEAEVAYKAAVKADDKAGEAHNNLAVLYLMKAQYPDAFAEVKAAEKAGFKVDPDLKDEIRMKMGG